MQEDIDYLLGQKIQSLVHPKFILNRNPALYERIQMNAQRIELKDGYGQIEAIYAYVNKMIELPKCKSCNNYCTYVSWAEGYRSYCSTKCASNSTDVKNKIKETNIKRFGVVSHMQTEEHKHRSSMMQLRYTDKKKAEINEKKKKTSLKNNGEEHYFKTNAYRKKASERMKTSEIREKIIRGVKDKYGVDNVSKSKEIRKKVAETWIKRTEDRITEQLGDNYKLVKYIDQYNLKINSNKCQHIFNTNAQLIYIRNKKGQEQCTVCMPIESHISAPSEELITFVESLGLDVKKEFQLTGTRLRLDLYIKEKNIGIEFNGLHWHSDTYRAPDYHVNKRLVCEKLGIRVIQVWQDDWIYKTDIIKGIITAALGCNKNITYARQHKIVINPIWQETFLEENHIQGNVSCITSVGLENNIGEPVAVMTFGNRRSTMGGGSGMELLRLCFKIGISVVGGAERMLAAYLEMTDTSELTSYCDRSYFTGNSYSRLGFKMSGTSTSYHYVVGHKRVNRYKFAKHRLVKLGYDKNKTEREITTELGYPRIYNAGTDKYVLKHN